jgi:hypothetical protein
MIRYGLTMIGFAIAQRPALSRLSPRAVAVGLAFGIIVVPAAIWALSMLLVIPASREQGRCPHCHSPRIRASWPRMSDKILWWLRWFRCEACLRRFHILKRTAKASAAAAAGGR